MRGKVRNYGHDQCKSGITPAYAGKSLWESRKSPVMEDHPRLCGEKSSHTPPQRYPRGSPPPMRGKDDIVTITDEEKGITPAYAGKSTKNALRFPAGWDHPRLCGEKTRAKISQTVRQGSPPPMRGKVVLPAPKKPENRITPAYAGKSQRQLHTQGRCQDHPRLCGEKTKKIPKQRYFFHQPASFSFSLQYT